MDGSEPPRPRFVRLGDRTLEYFRSDGVVAESKPLGVIEFSEVLRVTEGDASNALQCVVQAQYRRYTLHAESAEQCKDWREKIEKAVDDFQEFEELAQEGQELEPAELVEQLVEQLQPMSGGAGGDGAAAALALVEQVRRGLGMAQETMRQSAQFAAGRAEAAEAFRDEAEARAAVRVWGSGVFSAAVALAGITSVWHLCCQEVEGR
eukprot:SAG25_NODE_173_length_12920_cov_18.688168_7_plen_207_part_00